MNTIQDAPVPLRPYFRPTTASQRELLFRVAEATGNVSQAARQAHMGRSTYYYWRGRYLANGLADLAQERSRAPKRTRIAPVSEGVRAEVLAYYREHPDERGYRMIANRLRQKHGWPVIGHTKVGEIIRAARAAGQLDEPASPAPAAPTPRPDLPVVHAPQPGQTVHIDLCVVPLSHDGAHDLASMSLNAAAKGATPDPQPSPPSASDCPGRVFANQELTYAEQMRSYAQQRQAKRASKGERKHRRRQKQAARQALDAQSDELRVHRRHQRQVRRQEDAAWRKRRAAHRAAVQQRRQQSPAERRASRAQWQAEQESWSAARQQRRQQVEQRRAEDALWRQARQNIRNALAALAQVPLVTVWLAILVVVDSATRCCLQLPLFITGPHVTAEEIVAALRAHWPAGIEFVVSDNGAQFIAQAFACFAAEMEFLHVRIAPHHPQTNGLAERFVLTLKQWLEKRSWNGPDELAALLAEFIAYYNDRPHQAAELKGLSPNEYATRCRTCSSC
ncbi:MAG: integrase core domain-containing protein [Anaerolineae bacterium]|nr:integrase core domain-containing protein [Anaerolineae bacterium]